MTFLSSNNTIFCYRNLLYFMNDLSVNNVIQALYICGITAPSTIEYHFRRGYMNLSRRSIEMKCKTLTEIGYLPPSQTSLRGRKPVLTQEQKQRIVDQLEEEPYLTCPEIIQKARLRVSESTVYILGVYLSC